MTTETIRRRRGFWWLLALPLAALFCLGGFFLWLASGAGFSKLPPAFRPFVEPILGPAATQFSDPSGGSTVNQPPDTDPAVTPGGHGTQTVECQPGLVFDPILGVCIQVNVLPGGNGDTNPQCGAGLVFDPLLRICVQVNVLPPQNGTAVPACGAGLVFDPVLGICVQIEILPH